MTHPQDQHLSTIQEACAPIDAAAKLSDAQINSVAPGTAKVFKLVSPGEGDEPRATYYARSQNDYSDTTPSMNLLPLDWSNTGWMSTAEWQVDQGVCTDQRMDSECAFGNDCNRIFTDYTSSAGDASTIGCFNWNEADGGRVDESAGAYTGKRCYNDGYPCGHHLIQDFELWVRPAMDSVPAGTGSCAAIGGVGIFTLSPAGMEPFTARCDAEGFMKVLQIHDRPYDPTAGAFGVNPDDGIAGLVLSLSFEGSLADSSPRQQQATQSGSGALTFGDGVRGTGSFQFDGQTVISVAHSDSLNVESHFSVAAWVWIASDSPVQDVTLAEKGPGNGDWQAGLRTSTQQNVGGQFYLSFAGSRLYPREVQDHMRAVPAETWTHVAMTFDGSIRKIYVNGVLDGEDGGPPGSFIANGDPIEIGGRSSTSDRMFKGKMDEFKLFNRALSSQDVAQLASGALGNVEILQCNGGPGGRATAVYESSFGDIDVNEFLGPGEGQLADTGNSASVIGDVLQITPNEGSMQGSAFREIAGLSTSDEFIVRYQMYTGDGTGADGQCVNIGANDLQDRSDPAHVVGRNGEDGVADGIAVCFDEWANSDAEHGIQIFYNGEMLFEGRATCENQAGCAPVSYFNDATWHDVVVELIPDGTGGAKVVLDVDSGLYRWPGPSPSCCTATLLSHALCPDKTVRAGLQMTGRPCVPPQGICGD